MTPKALPAWWPVTVLLTCGVAGPAGLPWLLHECAIGTARRACCSCAALPAAGPTRRFVSALVGGDVVMLPLCLSRVGAVIGGGLITAAALLEATDTQAHTAAPPRPEENPT